MPLPFYLDRMFARFRPFRSSGTGLQLQNTTLPVSVPNEVVQGPVSSEPRFVTMLHDRRSRRAWFALAVAVVVLGTLTAYIGAAWVARSHAERDRQRFTAAAAEVANRIEVVIGHEDDLIIGASALVARTPSISNVARIN